MRKTGTILYLVMAICLAGGAFTLPAAQAEDDISGKVDIRMAGSGSLPAQQRLDKAILKARSVVQEEKELGLKKGIQRDKHLVTYTLIDGDLIYYYEAVQGEPESMQIVQNDTALQSVLQFKEATQPDVFSVSSSNDLPSGIGGRTYIHQNGSILTMTVRTATAEQMAGAPSGSAYTYSGFSGKGKSYTGASNFTVEADMGLQYSNSPVYGYVKWNPILSFYNGQGSYGTFVSPYNKVNVANGFKPGVDVNFTIYRNFNGTTRLSQSGYAWCSDSACTNKVDTYMTSVIEKLDTQVTSVTRWKTVVSIADQSAAFAAGNAYAEFKNIRLDGATVVPAVDAEDSATATVSGNNVTIEVHGE